MAFVVSLATLFRDVLIRYDSQGKALGQADINYPEQTKPLTLNANSGALGNQRTSYLGTPVVSDLKLEIYENLLNPAKIFEVDTALLDVVQTKNIITTSVIGRKGTIKEYIADGDFQITMRGAIVQKYGYFPEQEVRELVKILLEPKVIKPVSDFLRLFDIDQIVVTGYSFSQREGVVNTQFFEISALSDLPANLIIEA